MGSFVVKQFRSGWAFVSVDGRRVSGFYPSEGAAKADAEAVAQKEGV